MSARKKVRLGLPLELELSVGFLSAGDLKNFAGVSRACAKAAKHSFLSRLGSSVLLSHEEQLLKKKLLPKVSSTEVYLLNDPQFGVHRCRWWHCQRRDNGLLQRWCGRVTFRRNGSWMTSEEAGEIGPSNPSKIFDVLRNLQLVLPDRDQRQLGGSGGELHIRHCSLLHDILVVVFCKVTTMATDFERGHIPPNSPNTRNQLFVVVYNLSDRLQMSRNTHRGVLPTICEAIGPPVDRVTYGNLAGTKYGHCARSADGRVLAMMTAIPGEDHEMGGFFRDDAEISIFDLNLKCMDTIHSKGGISNATKRSLVSSSHANANISDTSNLTKRMSFCIPCGGYYDSGGVSIALSSMGDVISVTAQFAETVGPLWGVYDINAIGDSHDKKAEHSAREIFQFNPMPSSTMTIIGQLFSPDNELISRVSDFDLHKLAAMLKNTTVPYCATRVVFLVEE